MEKFNIDYSTKKYSYTIRTGLYDTANFKSGKIHQADEMEIFTIPWKTWKMPILCG